MPQTLTDAIVRDMEPPATGYRIEWDDLVKGFGARVTANGARSFVLNYWSAGHQRSMTLGSFPGLKTKDARAWAKEEKKEVARGADPVADKAARREAELRLKGMDGLVAEYRRVHLPKKAKSSQRGDEWLLDSYVIPVFGKKKIASITRLDVQEFQRGLKPITGNRALALLSKMFSLAVAWGWTDTNPVHGVEKVPEEARHRYLSDDEIQRLLKVLDTRSGERSADIVRLLLLTGARSGEVLGATWDQFDLENGVWTKPAAFTKQKRMHRVPLSRDALAIVQRLREAEDTRIAEAKTKGMIVPPEPHLFPGNGQGGVQTTLRRFWETICKAASIRGCRIHDLRHSFASILASQGASLPIIGQMLGHTQAATTQRYAHLLDAPLREAARLVAEHVDQAAKAPVKVVRLNPK